MTASGEFYIRIDRPSEIDGLLEILSQPGRASLQLDGGHDAPLPVALETFRSGEMLCLDISAIRDRPEMEAVRAGLLFRVVGQSHAGRVRTPCLTAEHVWEEAPHLYCQCVFPAYLEQLQRRDTFRAKLHQWMQTRVALRDGDLTTFGTLHDLSLNGCRVELDASAAALLDGRSNPLLLEMTFPDGTRFEAAALPRHQTLRHERILCGFSLDVRTRRQEHQLWRLVREIEREGARNAASGSRDLKRSPLFSGDTLDQLSASVADSDDPSTDD